MIDATLWRRAFDLICVGVILGYCWRVWAVDHQLPNARLFHDSRSYLNAAESDFFSRDLWAGARAPLPSAVFKVCGRDPEHIRRFFMLTSCASWGLLGWVITRSVESRAVRLLGLSLVLSLALSRDVLEWNEVVLSESLSLSAAALCVAFGLLFVKAGWRWVFPLVASAAVFALCRDSNAYVVLGAGVVLVGLAGVRRMRARAFWPFASVGLCFLATFALGNASADAGKRWEYPLTNVIVWRVLPDRAILQDFQRLGMPAIPRLRAHRPRYAYDTDPRLAPFRSWVAESGKRAYSRYLLSHPRYLFGEPAQGLEQMLGADVNRYAPRGLAAAEPASVEILWANSAWLARGTAVLLLCGAVLLYCRSVGALAWLGLLLTLLSYPHAMVVWHGDTMEVARHGLQVGLQVRLAFVLLLLGYLDLTVLKLQPRLARFKLVRATGAH